MFLHITTRIADTDIGNEEVTTIADPCVSLLNLLFRFLKKNSKLLILLFIACQTVDDFILLSELIKNTNCIRNGRSNKFCNSLKIANN